LSDVIYVLKEGKLAMAIKDKSEISNIRELEGYL
jgi:hypothetical protein